MYSPYLFRYHKFRSTSAQIRASWNWEQKNILQHANDIMWLRWEINESGTSFFFFFGVDVTDTTRNIWHHLWHETLFVICKIILCILDGTCKENGQCRNGQGTNSKEWGPRLDMYRPLRPPWPICSITNNHLAMMIERGGTLLQFCLSRVHVVRDKGHQPPYLLYTWLLQIFPSIFLPPSHLFYYSPWCLHTENP